MLPPAMLILISCITKVALLSRSVPSSTELVDITLKACWSHLTVSFAKSATKTPPCLGPVATSSVKEDVSFGFVVLRTAIPLAIADPVKLPPPVPQVPELSKTVPETPSKSVSTVSSLVPSAATSRPSTVPVTAMFPLTSNLSEGFTLPSPVFPST